MVKYWNEKRLKRMRKRDIQRKQIESTRRADIERKMKTYAKGDIEKNAALMLEALGEPVRRMLFIRLRDGGAMSLSKLGRPSKRKLPSLYKHMRILERSGLITTHKQGRVRMCVYNRDAIVELVQWLRR
jgi:DNA-binding transcriptional ArsR family regulator